MNMLLQNSETNFLLILKNGDLSFRLKKKTGIKLWFLKCMFKHKCTFFVIIHIIPVYLISTEHNCYFASPFFFFFFDFFDFWFFLLIVIFCIFFFDEWKKGK